MLFVFHYFSQYLIWFQDNITLGVISLVLFFLLGVFIHDVFLQKTHTIKHNYPIAGHLRYLLEKIGPELRQYIVAGDKEEAPFSRAERRWIYASSKGQNNYFGFGTTEELYEIGYPIIKNSAFPLPDDKAEYLPNDRTIVPCLKVIGESNKRKRPYRPQSVVNVSGMSYGALGKKATSALNQGAKIANCYHNTGEGGVSPYHLFGADLTLQMGTGYFGTRDENGNFSLDKLVSLTQKYTQIRLIEIKMSQGAKPGKGGVLPGQKVNAEIAQVRGIPQGKDCISPNSHAVFHDTPSLIKFIETIAEATGIPVGIKCAVGCMVFWKELSSAIKKKGGGPDFISIDGGEGGTGAAPLTYSDHVSLPFKTAFPRVYSLFKEKSIDKDIVWIGSGKLGFPDRTIIAFAMGCDLVNIAREAMISIGCIQAQKCHMGDCPTGVATQSRWLEAGLNVDDKAKRFAHYIRIFRGELLTLSHTAGYHHPSMFNSEDIEISVGLGNYKTLTHSIEYKTESPGFTRMSDYGPI